MDKKKALKRVSEQSLSWDFKSFFNENAQTSYEESPLLVNYPTPIKAEMLYLKSNDQIKYRKVIKNVEGKLNITS